MLQCLNGRRHGFWYDASQVEPRAKLACDTLRDEFAAFVRAVNPCFDVRSFTHQDLFRTYEQQVPTRDSRLAWLKARYF